ncbi:MAG: hypothetical protein JXQ71_11480 [Verrucomicrobia bacterium]|nr:hypothetical protein [Verrucomicrobiota bacterium]
MQPFVIRGLLACVCAAGLAALPLHAQNISKIKQSARNAVAAISVKVHNGRSTVIYKGKTVWTGKAKTQVSAKARSVDGKEYAAAYDGPRVVWENTKGAAKKLQ